MKKKNIKTCRQFFFFFFEQTMVSGRNLGKVSKARCYALHHLVAITHGEITFQRATSVLSPSPSFYVSAKTWLRNGDLSVRTSFLCVAMQAPSHVSSSLSREKPRCFLKFEKPSREPDPSCIRRRKSLSL